jgi:alpha-beta hydrolase superfamily lysophospholipase
MPAARFRRTLLIATLAAWAGQPSAPHAAVRSVTLRAADGVALAASYFEPSRRPAPAIVLVHMLTRTREDWYSVATRLADAGFATLAVDLRGHGGSGGNADDLAKMPLDLRAARAFFDQRSEASLGRVGLAGASLGANIAVLEAADDPAIRSIALFSPGLDYKGVRIEAAMKKYGDRPALLVAGANDPYAMRSVRQLVTIGGGVRDVRIVDGGGHGTAMFSRSPELTAALVDWFQRTLL